MQRRGESEQPVKGQSANRPEARKAPTAGVSTTDLQEQVATLTHKLTETREQLTEALEYQTATGEVLNVISRSPTDVQPVFDMIAQSAARLCEGQFCFVYRFDGQLLHFVAHHSLTPEVIEINRRAFPQPPSRKSVAARAILEQSVVQVPDVYADTDYALGELAAVCGYRSGIGIPILRDGVPIGSIAIARAQIGLFPDRQIELLKTFADQAAIAIENVRLFNETREALEQQTATSEVLKVISSSRGELEPVFNAMLANATRICEATFGRLWLFEGNAFRAVAIHSTQTFADYQLNPVLELRDHPGIPLDRIAKTKQVVHIPDFRADQSYIGKDSAIVTLVETEGTRSFVAVPMLKEGELIGAIAIYRQEVRPFTDKQIELVSNFAAQAVIAIENARLLNELRQRTDDLSESLEQQTATSEVLRVISSSAGELEPVFQAMLENATRICEARFGNLLLYENENDAFRMAAMHGAPPEFAEKRGREPIIHPSPKNPLFRVAKTRQLLHIIDLRIDEAYVDGDLPTRAFVELAGTRTIVVVPMLKDDKLIGAIGIYRQEVRPFTDKQIELLKNFAAQAVIAIENTRLLNELHQRTDDLTESLEQQTATSEVLKVISSSPGELEPVFQAMLENATRICEAKIGILFRYENDAYSAIATLGVTPAYAEYLSRGPIQPGPTTGLGRVASTRQTIHIVDTQVEKAYADREPLRVATAELGGARTLLNVPLLKEGNLIGAIGIYRQDVRPFTDKQIELVTSFAAQAVIAIENTRLLNELRESLQQQTATSEVLKVISSSPGELQPVFQAMLTNAMRICEAKFATLYLREADAFRAVAVTHEVPPAYVEARKRELRLQPSPDGPLNRAAITKQVVHITDIRDLQSYRDGHPFIVDAVELGGFRTALAVPMLKDDELIGVITIMRQEVRPFTDKQIDLVKNFASQAVIAIENTRLLSELRESLQQQTATADVLKVISRSAFDLQTVLATLVESATRLCEADHAWLFERKGDVFGWVAGYGHATETNARIRDYFVEHPVGVDRGSITGRAVLEGRVVHVTDVLADPEYTWGGAQKIGGYRAALGVPLWRKEEVVGVIFVARTAPKPYTEKQIELVTTFGDQAVIAIENTRLLSELRESLQQQTATADVLKVISHSTFDLQTVLDTLTESAARLCDADIAAIIRQKDETNYWATSYGLSAEQSEYVKNVPIEPVRGNVAGRVLLTGKTVHVADVLADPEYTYLNAQKIAGHRATLGVPLLREGAPIGVVLLMRRSPQAFTDKQIELVETFADQAVIAIENVRLFDEVQARTRDLSQALEQQTATSEVLKVISSSLNDLKPVFDTIGQRAEKLCEAEVSVISMVDGDLIRLVSVDGITEEGIEAVRRVFPMQRDDETVTARAIRSSTVCHIPDVLSDALYQTKDAARVSGYRACLAVPMIREGQVIGAIFVAREQPGLFTDAQVQLLKTFADQAVIAIENVRLFNETKGALEQQTATADVLKLISRSTFDLRTVLQTLIESAARFCDADKASVIREKNGIFCSAEAYGYSREFMDYVQDIPIKAERGTASGRALLEGQVVHIADVKADPEYTLVEGQRLGDYHTILCVPMLREGVPIGVLVLTRSEVRPFTDKQIELVTTFADQAAIAIENVRLFESVEARTRELAASLEDLRTTQDRLVQTEKLASLGQLTAGIAHEIKNPLNFVNNFSGVSAELIDELQDTLNRISIDHKARGEIKELTDTLRGNLDKVVQHGKRADAIVKNMLLHSRAGSGEHRPVDINAVVEESLNLAWHGARAEKQGFNITLEKSFDPTAGEADVFPQEITRALLNLISNGFYAATKRKAETNGGGYEPTLAATTKNLGDRVEIRIRDNGTGIPPEVRHKLFNPFFTTKPAGEGTGLGLSISHDIIVKQHGGSIEVDTQPGEFTEIRIVLPRGAVP